MRDYVLITIKPKKNTYSPPKLKPNKLNENVKKYYSNIFILLDSLLNPISTIYSKNTISFDYLCTKVNHQIHPHPQLWSTILLLHLFPSVPSNPRLFECRSMEIMHVQSNKRKNANGDWMSMLEKNSTLRPLLEWKWTRPACAIHLETSFRSSYSSYSSRSIRFYWAGKCAPFDDGQSGFWMIFSSSSRGLGKTYGLLDRGGRQSRYSPSKHSWVKEQYLIPS